MTRVTSAHKIKTMGYLRGSVQPVVPGPYLRGTRVNHWAAPLTHVPYTTKWNRRQPKRLKKGRTTNTHQITNKGDMIIRAPKRMPQARLGRDCSFTSAVRQPGTLYFYRIGANIAKGTDMGTRVGDSIRILGFNFRMQAYNNNTNPTFHGKLRCIVVQDRRPTVSNLTDFFMPEGATNTPIDFGAGPDSFRLLRPVNINRFKVYYDKTFDFPISTNEDQNQMFLNEYIKFNVEMTYNNDAPAVEGILPSLKFYYFVENEENLAFSTAPLFKILDITHFAN